MKKVKKLYADFKPERYRLYLKQSPASTKPVYKLKIQGKKTGRPSHRLTFHQKNLKVVNAKIYRHDKSGDWVIYAGRINHLAGFQEVRLHTKDILRPGNYSVELNYELNQEKAQAIAAGAAKPNREFLPCIDEPEAWTAAVFEVKP